jgi:pre-60S factor REI1
MSSSLVSASNICNSCGLVLEDEFVRDHYSSAFHHVNLKRRVADIAPLSIAAFEKLRAEKETKDKEMAAAEEEVLYICDACKKKFHSEGQFNSHNSSKRHRETVQQLLSERSTTVSSTATDGVSKDDTDIDKSNLTTHSHDLVTSESSTLSSSIPKAGTGELIITAAHCLFCWLEHASVEASLKHMLETHSFFIPDVEFCDDLIGLLEYLHAKIIEGRMCLYCDTGKQYDSAEAVRQHMRDKGHCLMRYDDERNFSEFEDFFDYATKNEEDEGEEEGEDEAILAADTYKVVGTTGKSYISTNNELVLSSGARAVHRDIAIYYKQHLRLPDDRKSVRLATDQLALDNAASSSSGSGGGSGQSALSISLTKGTIRGNLVDRRTQRRVEKRQSKFMLRTGTNFNMILRRWFRVRILE